MPVSFATDIRPLFRDSPDVDSIQGYGLEACPVMNPGRPNGLGFLSSGWMRASHYRLCIDPGTTRESDITWPPTAEVREPILHGDSRSPARA
jgi:hypothetical protein